MKRLTRLKVFFFFAHPPMSPICRTPLSPHLTFYSCFQGAARAETDEMDAADQTHKSVESDETAESELFFFSQLRHLTNLPTALRTIERLTIQNILHERQLAYRNLSRRDRRRRLGGQTKQTRIQTPPTTSTVNTSSATASTASSGGLSRLWGYGCVESKGRNVSALSWNCENRELLAAAYGEWHISRQDDRGLILVWSPQNPTCPERTIRCHCGVVSMSWCGRANLLAAGLYDGRVRVYDLCKSAEALRTAGI